MTINTDDVKKLARLTRLRLTPEEEQETLTSLNAVINLIDQLKSADVDDINPMAYVQLHGQTLRTRPPQPLNGYPTEQVMANAPASDNDCFLVPEVIE